MPCPHSPKLRPAKSSSALPPPPLPPLPQPSRPVASPGVEPARPWQPSLGHREVRAAPALGPSPQDPTAAPSWGSGPRGTGVSTHPQSPGPLSEVLTCSHEGRLGCPRSHPHPYSLGPRTLLLLLVKLEGWERRSEAPSWWSDPPITAGPPVMVVRAPTEAVKDPIEVVRALHRGKLPPCGVMGSGTRDWGLIPGPGKTHGGGGQEARAEHPDGCRHTQQCRQG